jgi:hypothetical protein
MCEIRTGKTGRGIGQRRRRDRPSSRLRERERVSIGLKWFWRGLKMTVEEIEHLSIFSNANQ